MNDSAPDDARTHDSIPVKPAPLTLVTGLLKPSETPLSDFPLVFSLPLQWGDQDLFGHVNNAVYIKWFETARMSYADYVGWGEVHDRERIGPILAAIHCNYRRQLKYPDRVFIGASVTRIGRTSLTMRHAVHSEAQSTVVADGESIVVAFDYNSQRPTPIPAAIRQTIESIQGRTFDAS